MTTNRLPEKATEPSLRLHILPGRFQVLRLKSSDRLHPSFDVLNPNSGYDFLSVTRTKGEISIVVSPPPPSDASEGMDAEVSEVYRCIMIQGPMPLHLTGIMSELTRPLADAKVAIFALSTWDTDWVLVKEKQKQAAVSALKTDGWVVVED